MGSGLHLLLWWLLAALVCRVSGAYNDDCEILPPPSRPSGEKITSHGVNSTQRHLLLQLHNAAREKVASGQEKRGNPGPQPPAAEMKELIWDDELAAKAQKWANRREFRHNPCQSTKNYEFVGENLAIQSWVGAKPSDYGWTLAVNDWYEEVVDWPNKHVSSYKFNSKTGHYTQLVWGETKRIGCGVTNYVDGNEHSMLFVCNYEPAGNFIDEPVYKEGPPRSACPGNRRRRRRRRLMFQSLC